MSALCVGACRPDENGGPRQAEATSHLCSVCSERIGQNLGTIADLWQDLDDRLGHDSGNVNDERVSGSPSRGLVINERVSELEREIGNWAWFVAKNVLDERGCIGPKDQTTPGLLRWLADIHSDWLAHHTDEMFVAAVSTEAFDFAREAHRIAYPSGARRVDLPGLQCVEHVENALGERIPCEGTMFVVAQPDMALLPDLICTYDRHHRMEPAVWRRRSWQSSLNTEATRALLTKISTP